MGCTRSSAAIKTKLLSVVNTYTLEKPAIAETSLNSVDLTPLLYRKVVATWRALSMSTGLAITPKVKESKIIKNAKHFTPLLLNLFMALITLPFNKALFFIILKFGYYKS